MDHLPCYIAMAGIGLAGLAVGVILGVAAMLLNITPAPDDDAAPWAGEGLAEGPRPGRLYDQESIAN